MKSLFSRSFVLSVLVCTFVFGAFVSATEVKAQSASSICSTIEALIAAGVIAPDKANTARLAAGCTTTPTFIFTRDLTVGSSGADVVALQNRLGLTPATGYFGENTRSAVQAYQTSMGIPATGNVDAQTRAALNANSVPVTSGNLQATVTDAPTNSLSYSVGGQVTEVYLNGKLGVTLDAAGGDVYVYTKTTAVFADDSMHSKYEIAELVNTTPAEIVTIPDSMYSAIKIPEGKSVKVVISAKADTSTMFAGSYNFEVPTIVYAPDLNVKNNKEYFLKAGTSNRILIIGETSPYIKTIDTQVNANGQVVLGVYGQRLTNSAGYFQCGDVAGDLKFATGMSNTDDKLFFDISNLKPNEYCSVKLVNKSTGESNRAGFTVPASYRSPVNIFWSGGNKKVMIGIVDDRFDPKSSKDSVILGWISLNGEQKGNVIWDGYIIKDLTGTVNWNIDSLSNGPFRILGVTEGKTGNLCTSENGDCNYVLSDSFALSTDKNEITVSFNPTSIKLTSPNGGESYKMGTTINIKWSSNLPIAGTSYNISALPVSKCGPGQTCVVAPIAVANNVAGTEYKWLIPNDLVAGEMRISVCTEGKSMICDTSDEPFIVVSAVKPSLKLEQKTVDESDFKSGTALLPAGAELLLHWISENATGCVASANPKVSTWLGNKSTDGLGSVGKVDVSRTYKLSCTGPGGSVEKSIDVMVQGKPVPVQPIPVTPVTPATTTPATTTPVVPVKPNPTMPTNTSIKLAEIYCNKGDWVGKNSVIGMWLKKDAKYNPDPRFVCHTDKTIYRCTKDADETSGASYWNTFSTRVGDGAPTTNYVCSKSAGKWVNR